MNKKPLISIIIAVYNGESTLQKCIDSIVNQTYSNFELIIIDGESTDRTINILRENTGLITYWVSEPDKGIYDAWNKALNQARGEWFYFIGADDYLSSGEILGTVSKKLSTAYPKYNIVYGQIVLVDSEHNETHKLGRPWALCESHFWAEMCLPHQSMFHHKSIFSKFGQFNDKYTIAGDYELLIQVCKNQPPLYMGDVVVAMMGDGGVSSRPDLSMKALKEMRLARIQHGAQGNNKLWFWIYLKAIIKYYIFILFGNTVYKKISFIL